MTDKTRDEMSAQERHHSDILDTLTDYLTRPEVDSIHLDHDENGAWDITATVEVDPAAEARKLEREMAEAVGLANSAPKINVTVTDPAKLRDSLASLYGPSGDGEKDEPLIDPDTPIANHIPVTQLVPLWDDSAVAIELKDADKLTWRCTWTGKWVLSLGGHRTVSLPYGELVDGVGPLTFTKAAPDHLIENLRTRVSKPEGGNR